MDSDPEENNNMSQDYKKVTVQQLKRWIINSIKSGAWAPIIVFSIHLIATFAINIYDFYPSFDIPMHFLGGMSITFFFMESVICAKDLGILGSPSITVLILIIILLTCTTTIFWEFGEWVLDKVFFMHTQVSLDDTLLDMLLGILGGITMIRIRFKNIIKRLKN